MIMSLKQKKIMATRPQKIVPANSTHVFCNSYNNDRQFTFKVFNYFARILHLTQPYGQDT